MSYATKTYQYRGYQIDSAGRNGGCWVYSPSGADVTKLANYGNGSPRVWSLAVARAWIDKQPDALAKRVRKSVRIKTPRVVSDGGRRVCGYSHEYNDCTVRAIAHARCISYTEAHTLCAQIFGRKDKHGTRYTELILNRQSWVKPIAVHLLRGMTLDKFALLYPRGHFVLTTARHSVAVCDGVIYDAWKISGLCRVESAHEVIE